MTVRQMRVVPAEVDPTQYTSDVLLLDENGDPLNLGGGGAVAWADVTGKPSTFPPVVGTTSTTAKAGNYVPAWTEVTSKPTTFAPPAATSSVVGGVKQAAAVANSTATDVAGVVANLNSLLASLRASGALAS